MAAVSSKRRKCTAEVFSRVLALEVLVGDRIHAVVAAHLHPAAILEADEQRELALALADLGELDEEGGLPVAAVGDQGVVGVELFLDALGLEDALGAQHFLDLILHGQPVLEGPGDVGSDSELAIALVLEQAARKAGRSRA